MKKCLKCANELADLDIFCSRCGTKYKFASSDNEINSVKDIREKLKNKNVWGDPNKIVLELEDTPDGKKLTRESEYILANIISPPWDAINGNQFWDNFSPEFLCWINKTNPLLNHDLIDNKYTERNNIKIFKKLSSQGINFA